MSGTCIFAAKYKRIFTRLTGEQNDIQEHIAGIYQKKALNV